MQVEVLRMLARARADAASWPYAEGNAPGGFEILHLSLHPCSVFPRGVIASAGHLGLPYGGNRDSGFTG